MVWNYLLRYRYRLDGANHRSQRQQLDGVPPRLNLESSPHDRIQEKNAVDVSVCGYWQRSKSSKTLYTSYIKGPESRRNFQGSALL
jgi:hypothetical protein